MASFFIYIGFILSTFYLLLRFRISIAQFFLRLPLPRTLTIVLVTILFSIIEEASINIASGTLYVLFGTVPALVIFILAFGYGGKLLGFKRIWIPLIALLIFGAWFEIYYGGKRDAFQSAETGELIFGLIISCVTYTYAAIISHTMIIEQHK